MKRDWLVATFDLVTWVIVVVGAGVIVREIAGHPLPWHVSALCGILGAMFHKVWWRACELGK